jgi:hypothetical protein
MYPGLRRIAAMKFYSAGQAARSAVSTGQELADDFLDGMGDAKGAIDVIEQHVLPMMREANKAAALLGLQRDSTTGSKAG